MLLNMCLIFSMIFSLYLFITDTMQRNLVGWYGYIQGNHRRYFFVFHWTSGTWGTIKEWHCEVIDLLFLVSKTWTMLFYSVRSYLNPSFLWTLIHDRRFRTTDVPSLVSKGAPPFCTVYIISKGKISSVKTASAPLTAKPTPRNNALLQPQLVQQSLERMDAQLTRNHVPPRCIYANLFLF